MDTDNTRDGAEPSPASAGSHGLSEAEIDALEYVVVEGRMASKQDYGVLRALLVRLRPEWATSGDLGLRPEEGDLRNGSPDGRETVQ
jgi:hypothetical protein